MEKLSNAKDAHAPSSPSKATRAVVAPTSPPNPTRAVVAPISPPNATRAVVAPSRGSNLQSRKWKRGAKISGNVLGAISTATKLSKERRVQLAIASYLPTGLILQLHDGVHNEAYNPRLPRERFGVYLCLRLTGMHSLPELPWPADANGTAERVAKVASTITSVVAQRGGELLRLAGDMALAIWSVAPDVEGDSTMDASSSDAPQPPSAPQPSAAAMKKAVNAASAAALETLEQLNNLVLWRPEPLGRPMTPAAAPAAATPG